MSKQQLNQKQALVYNYIKKTIANSLPPTVREICEATGIRSTSTVHAALSWLEEEGYIVRDAKSSRSIRLAGSEDSAMVPLIGKVTAGQPILAVEEIESYIPYPVSSERSDSLFALRVSGLSMRDAGILDGDIIIADKDLGSHNGDIVVAMIEDEATVKRLVIERGEKPYLMPENPDFDPIRPDYMEILGRVIGSFRRY
ncbi:MAG: transcriptional repressor LexA [Ruminococcaceae bacterium]|nr:transcriptional repressor LexA [Oscillospiraceae bacterium]